MKIHSAFKMNTVVFETFGSINDPNNPHTKYNIHVDRLN